MTNQFKVGDLVKGGGSYISLDKGVVDKVYGDGEFLKLKILDYKDKMFIGEKVAVSAKDFELYDV